MTDATFSSSSGSRSAAVRYGYFWFATAVLVGGLLAFAEYDRNPLNDPDQAFQRTGVLEICGQRRAPVLPGGLRPGRRTIVIFARSLKGQPLFHDLADQADLAAMADLVVVTTDGSRPLFDYGVRAVVTDPAGTLAKRFGLRRPIDGGPPIGYALVDDHGDLRHATIDPSFAHWPSELKLLVGAM